MTPADYYTTSAVINELETYLATPPEPAPDIISWWRDHETIYLHLVKMAYDLHSIPAMSAEIERIFNLAKIMIQRHRGKIQDDLIEALQYLKN